MEKKPITDRCCKCDNVAVAFWPAIDPDIQSHPYCRQCLNQAKFALLREMEDLWTAQGGDEIDGH
jgi:hypothetical protein